LAVTYARPKAGESYVARPTISALQRGVADFFSIQYPITKDLGDTVTIGLGAKVPGANVDEPLSPLTSIMVDFPSHWQKWALDPALKLLPDPPPPADDNTYLPADWTAYSFELTSGNNAPTLFKNLATTGVRIKEIGVVVTWASSEGSSTVASTPAATAPTGSTGTADSTSNILTWKVKGEIYASH